MKTRKRKMSASKEEIENDPSLRWFAYKQFECLWSDELNDFVRFYEYNADGSVTVAAMNSMAVMDGKYDRLKLRRLTSTWTRQQFRKEG